MSERVRLSLADIESYRNQGKGMSSRKYRRFYCPIHEGDNQRSFSLELETGYFRCFSCGAWGYLEERAQAWIEAKKQNKPTTSFSSFKPKQVFAKPQRTPSLKTKSEPLPEVDFAQVSSDFQKALPKSAGEDYLIQRGISLEIALEYGIGYAENGKWPHLKDGKKVRQSAWGKVVFPHSTPEGKIINLYGRAVEKEGFIPSKEEKHAHLPEKKGIFNAKALTEETVFICESGFNAMSLISAGHKNACALFGLNGFPWRWIKSKKIVFCLDQDSSGKKQQKELLWEGVLRGYKVFFLPNEVYGAHKDLNEVWIAERKIDIGQWEEDPEDPWSKKIQKWSQEMRESWEEKSAILEFESGLSRKEAEKKAFEEIKLKL